MLSNEITKGDRLHLPVEELKPDEQVDIPLVLSIQAASVGPDGTLDLSGLVVVEDAEGEGYGAACLTGQVRVRPLLRANARVAVVNEGFAVLIDVSLRSLLC